MKAKKKTYVLLVSKFFPKAHPKGGQETFFDKKILKNGTGVYCSEDNINPLPIMLADDIIPKIHTIRANYSFWKKRIDKINAGEAVLSLRQWIGKPYRSKQKEFLRLDRVGIQRVWFLSNQHWCYIDGMTNYLQFVSKNDGLTEHDFADWFKRDFTGCIIHFTDFKY